MERLGFFGVLKYLILTFKRGIMPYFKYQIITKLLFAAIFSPLFWAITQFLIDSRGVYALSNSGIFRFLLTPQGMVTLVLIILFVSLGILLELFGTISISSRILKNKPESDYINIQTYNFKSLRYLLDPGSIFLFIYLIILIPLTGTGTSISFLQRIKIPNFITSVIFENREYFIIYALIIALFATVSMFTIFSFHFIIIGKYRASKAIGASVILVRKNLKLFLKKFLGISAVIALIAGTLIVFWLLGIANLVNAVNVDKESTRIFLIVLYFIQELGLRVIGLFFVPFEIHHLTIIFYNLVSKTPEYSHLYHDYAETKEKSRRTILDKLLDRKRTILAILLISIIVISVPFGLYFNEMFRYERSIVIIGHRGGGGSGIPENTISSINRSIALEAQYVEIDVQRTADDKYIINHDNTFNRMAGDGRSALEMTLEEIKDLDLGYRYPGYEGERVPTIEEVLDVTKEKIGIYLELKGITADRRMADDLIKLVRERNLLDHVVFVSLNYDLVNYMETNYPDAQTGYIYYLAVGQAGSFNSDVIILEEYMATDSTLTDIYFSEKLPVVWTVNDERLLEKYVDMGIYGVITDNVEEAKSAIRTLNSESNNSFLLKMFLQFN